MTLEERLAAMEDRLAKLSVNTLAEGDPSGYYTSVYSGEEIDQAVGDVRNGNLVIPSTTSGSDKKFRLIVDDSGTVTAAEVTGA